MRITQQTLSLKTSYDHQQESVRKQEVLPTLAKPGQQDVKVEVSLQQRDALGVSLSRRDLQKAAEQNRQQQSANRSIALPSSNVAVKKSSADPAPSASSGATSSQKTSDELSDDDLSLDTHTRLIKMMIEAMTGKKIKLMQPIQHTSATEPSSTAPNAPTTGNQSTPAEPDHQVRITEYTSESERLRFAASGEVQTADGRTIKLQLGFAMSYQDMTLSERITKQSALKDPLVLNLDSQFADLKEARFNFDIDSDGTQDSLPTLGNGSYFLALDKNNNQQIDDGKELFGAQSGNGFAELAQYDEDGNSFIDEGDSIYGQLSVWRPGKGMVALANVGVGAIYLHPVETQFQNLGSDSEGGNLGVLRSSGIYLKEDGTAGTVQQLDLRA
ncbi:MAG: hypothetical protein PHV54_08630 [Tolumonas sp.]|nr:hypothetical protein [Tolumonas sp.]